MSRNESSSFPAWLCLLFTVSHLLLEGLATMKLWQWFVSPAIGLPLLTYKASLGVSLLVALLTTSYATAARGHTTEEWDRRYILSVAVPLVTLIVGYVIHHTSF
jgi:hypothetical protein